MNAKQKMVSGSMLILSAGAAVVLSLVLNWSEAPRPWGFLLGFIQGIAMGLGAVLALAGMIAYRKRK